MQLFFVRYRHCHLASEQPKSEAIHYITVLTMTAFALTLGSGLIAFGPFLSLFTLIVYKKAQLVIVVTSAAFFFLLASVAASFAWSIFHAIGLNGPLSAIVPGVIAQFLFRCGFVAMYHRVEQVIKTSLDKQHNEELKRIGEMESDGGTGSEHVIAVQERRKKEMDVWTETVKLRLELNDAACGIAAGVGFGGMHTIMLYGTLLASETSNNVGVLYQDSCPGMPSLVLSAIYAFCFSILDIFWMLFTFFGMRRRLMFHRGGHAENEVLMVGSWLGNSRMGGNYSLMLSLLTHIGAATFTSADFFNNGCSVSIPGVAGIVLLTAYMFWAGCGRIYMPPGQDIGTPSGMMGRPSASFHEE
jgi:hypothetical protein